MCCLPLMQLTLYSSMGLMPHLHIPKQLKGRCLPGSRVLIYLQAIYPDSNHLQRHARAWAR